MLLEVNVCIGHQKYVSEDSFCIIRLFNSLGLKSVIKNKIVTWGGGGGPQIATKNYDVLFDWPRKFHQQYGAQFYYYTEL